MKAAKELRVTGSLFVKPTMDALPKKIRELSSEEQLRLISEPETLRDELGSMANIEHVADLLTKFRVVERPVAISGR